MKTLELKGTNVENVKSVGFIYNDGVSDRWYNYAIIEIDDDGRVKVDSYWFSKMDSHVKFNSEDEAKEFIEKRFVNQFEEV